MAKITRDIYRGKAVIISIELQGVEDWKEFERRNLSENDKMNAFKAFYEVAEGDEGGTRHRVIIEFSHRELRGDMLDYYKREDGSIPTQMDAAIRPLVQQGLLAKGAKEADIGDALDDSLVGREVYIRAYEELGKDGAKWWPRCVFASKIQRLTGADKAARLAAFLGGKPAPKPTAVTADASAMPSAPADDDDMPF